MPVERQEREDQRAHRPGWVGYAATVLLVAALAVGLLLLRPVLPLGRFPMPYIVVTMTIAYVFGLGPALLACVLSWLVFVYFFVPPLYSLHVVLDQEGWARQVAFVLGVVIVGIASAEASKATRRIAERTVRLEVEVAERERAQEELRNLAADLEQRVTERTAQLETAFDQERSARTAADAAEARVRHFLEMAPDGILIATRDGVISSANNKFLEMFGYERDELLGERVEKLIPERYREGHVQRRADYIAEPRTRAMGVGLELYGLRKDGTEFSVEIALSPTYMDGEMNVTAIIRDVTERKRAEEHIKKLNSDLRQRAADLEIANSELEAFSYSVSHDLRAPLRAIDGFSNTLLKNYLDSLDERGKDYLQRVRAAAQRMGQLIDDILGLSRASRAEMRRQSVDMSAMAAEVLAELQKSQPERRTEVVIAPDLTVNADAHLLRIALGNLLGNAWKFTSKSEVSRIEVGTIEQNGERVYFIRDNGAGFNPAYADKLFSPFQRLHAETDFPGTGIGLALVQRILRRHGGRIWAESAIDQGATFYFTLGEVDG